MFILFLNFKFFDFEKRCKKKLSILEKNKGISAVNVEPYLISNKKSVAIVSDKSKIFDAATETIILSFFLISFKFVVFFI